MFWTSNLFLIKENWIFALTGHHVEPNIDILFARNLPFESYVRQWSHPLMIQLHYLWAKSNNRTCGELVLFLFWFLLFTCTVWLLFHSLFTFSSCANKTGWLQKWVLKMWMIINKRQFVIFWTTAHTHEYEAMKK